MRRLSSTQVFKVWCRNPALDPPEFGPDWRRFEKTLSGKGKGALNVLARLGTKASKGLTAGYAREHFDHQKV
jgi:hypothetical protein